MERLTDLLLVVCTHVIGKCRCTASQVSDAHRAGVSVSIDLAEGLYLHRTGEGNQNRRNHIRLLRDETDRKQDQNLQKQNSLPPVKFLGIFVFCLKTLRKKYTTGESQKWEQILDSLHPLSHHQVRAHQYDVTGLRVGEYLISCKISVRILKSSGQRQKHTRNKSFRHLHIGSQFLKFSIHHSTSCLIDDS